MWQFTNGGKVGHTFRGSLYETSSEDHPLSSPTLSTWFISLHEALQASTGKVDLIHMIRHTRAIETGSHQYLRTVTQKTDS